MPNRRRFLQTAAAASLISPWAAAATASPLRLRYLLATAMYGQEPLGVVLDEARKLGIDALDLWPKVHGAHREVIDELGPEQTVEQVRGAGCRIECLTRYDLGALGLTDEIEVAASVGARTIVTGPKQKNPPAGELKAAVRAFVEAMRPTLSQAANRGVTVAIENHRKNLFETGDSLRHLADALDDAGEDANAMRIALAPAHLPQDAAAIASLIADIGPKLHIFYGWERGNEFLRKQPTGRELEQLPGRGPLDFGPIVDALAAAAFDGWTSIFMHPIPRGIPAAGTVDETTTAIIDARTHLESLAEG